MIFLNLNMHVNIQKNKTSLKTFSSKNGVKLKKVTISM